jgi:ferric-dicitrate binding protein FerR (iron transport regulator)
MAATMQRDHTNEIDPTTPITEQASRWWVLLNEGSATPADCRAFGEWVSRSPERVEAYLQAARLTLALKSHKTRWPDTPIDDLVRAARAAPSEVVGLPSAPSGSKGETRDSLPAFSRWFRLARLRGPIIATMAVASVAVLVTGLYFYVAPLRLQTGVGEQRSVVLGDGSLVTLNTSSSIEVQMAKDRRTVTLLAGEALFEVAHDARRPFDVTTADTTVRAVGTQFDVDRRAASTTVTVVEGRVAVYSTPDGAQRGGQTTQPLGAGEQLTLAPRSAHKPVRADVATAIAWTQRKLIFEHRQLGEVAAEFNRYNRQVIEIQSAELRNQEVTGVFQANDPGSFLTFLSRLPGVTIQQSADHSRFVVTQQTRDKI